MKIHVRRGPFIVALLTMVLSMMAVGISAKQALTKPNLASNTSSSPVLNLEAGQVSTAGPQSPMASTPNSANYVFTTSTSGAFTDMSSGTTQLVAADIDDGASTVQTLPFDFYLMGKKYNQFSVTSNGMLGLGSTAVVSSLYTVYGGSTTTPVIAAFGGDLRTGAAGSVRYKVTGTAPNRVVTIEYNNMSLLNVASPGSNDGTYQVRLYESTGQIEFVYGPVSRNSGTSALNGQQVGIGWSTANSANNMVRVLCTQTKGPGPQ